MLLIEGSEGGGQILRTSLGFSALTRQAFEIVNVRKNRPNPGLRPQHLSCVKAVSEVCNGSYEDAELSSSSLKFYPRDIKSRTFSVDIGTAGSITLLLQSLLLPIIFGGKKFKVKVTGGTSVSFSPTSLYFAKILLPHLKKFCTDIEYNVLREGFMQKGGGVAELIVKPKFPLSEYKDFPELLGAIRNDPSTKLNLTQQGNLLQIKGMSTASIDLQKAEVAERQAKAARMKLGKLGVPVNIDSSYSDSFSTGSVITLWAIFSESEETSEINPIILGSSCLGERGKKAEEVGMEVAAQLLREIDSKAPVDKHLADQLLPFLALAGGKITVSQLTPHCLSNIYTIEKFLGKTFDLDKKNNVITSA